MKEEANGWRRIAEAARKSGFDGRVEGCELEIWNGFGFGLGLGRGRVEM